MANPIIELLLRLKLESDAAKQQAVKEFQAIRDIGRQAGESIAQASQSASGGLAAFSQLAQQLRAVSGVAPQAGSGVRSVAEATAQVRNAGGAAFTAMATSLEEVSDKAADAGEKVKAVVDATKLTSAQTGAFPQLAKQLTDVGEASRQTQASVGAFSQLSRNLQGVAESAPAAGQGIQKIAESSKAVRDTGASAFTNLARGLTGTRTAAQEAATRLGLVGVEAARTAENANRADQSTRRLNTGTVSLTGSMEGLVGAVRAVVVGFVGLSAVQFLKNMADQAARTQVLGTVLNTVALNAGISNTQVAKLDASVQGLGISAQASRTALTGFIQSGLDVSKAAALARASQDLAVIAGEDSSTVFQRVILNVQQLDTVGLKYNGVIVTMEEATQNYLKALGQQSRELTRSEQQQALLNEVLRKAAEVSGVYEKSMGDVGKQLTSLNRLQQEAAVSIGNNLLPAYLVLVQEFTTFLKQSKLITDEFGAQGSGAKKLADSIRPLAVALREIAVIVVQNIDVISTLAGAYLGLKAGALVFGALVTIARPLGTAILAVGQAFVFLQAGIGATTKLLPGLIALTRAAVVSMAPLLLNPVVLGFLALAAVLTVVALKWRSHNKEVAAAAEQQKLLANDGKALQAQLTNNLTQRLTLTERIDQATADMVEAQRRGDEDAEKAAKTRKEDLQQRLKDLDAENVKLRALAATNNIKTDVSEAQAAANKAAADVRKKVEDIGEQLKKLGLDSSDAFKGLNISSEFSKEFGQVEQVLDAFLARTQDTNGQLVVSVGQVGLAFTNLVSSAKSFDEIGKALDLIRTKAQGSGGPLISALVETATFNQGTAAIKELDQVLAGYIARVAETAKNTELLRGVATDTTNFINGLRTTFFELGSSLQVADNGIVQVTGSLQKAAGSRAGLAALEASSAGIALSAANNRYREEEASINRLDTRRKEIATSEVNSQRNVSGLITAIDRDTTNRRIDNAKTYYDALRVQQDAYTQKVRESASRLREIEQQLSQSRRSEEQVLFDLRLSGLTEQQRRQEQITRAETLSAQARLALSQGNLELAKQASDEQVDMAKALASSAQNEQERFFAAEKVKTAYEDQRRVLEAQKKDEQERQRIQIESLNAVTTSINELKATFTSLTQGGSATVKLDIDRTALDSVQRELDAGKSTKVSFLPDDQSLRALRDSVQQALNGIKFQVQGSSDAIQGFATGGKVYGPGTTTSDSIPAMLSRDEWVHNARATRYYGDQFMDDINNLRLPRAYFADGGKVGPITPGGGSVDQVDMNLNFNGRRVATVRTSHSQARALADALQELERGL